MFEAWKRQRSALMGVAILWVMLFHFGFQFGIMPLNLLKGAGYGGVDIFMLCTGFGAAHSLYRCHDSVAFYKKRAVRILPTYYIFIIVFMVLHCLFLAQMSVWDILGNLTLTGYWNGDKFQFNWYISSLPVYYLLCPIFYGFLTGKKKRVHLRFAVLLAVLLVFSLAFLTKPKLIFVSRIPLMAVGIYCGILQTEKDAFPATKKSTAVLNAVLMGALLVGGALLALFYKRYYNGDTEHSPLIVYGLYWYPFILVAPGLSMLICYAFNLLCKVKAGEVLAKLFGFVGAASFEIYLVHIGIKVFAEQHPQDNLHWAVYYAAALAGGLLFKWITDLIFKRNKQKNKAV